MARSNGPQSPPPGGRTPRPDPQNWAQGTPAPRAPGRPAAAPQAASNYQQAGYAAQPQSAGAAYQQAAYAAQPSAPADPRYAQPAAAPQAQSRPAQAQAQAQAPRASAFEALMSQEDPHSYGTLPAYAPASNGHQAAYPAAQTAAPAPYGNGSVDYSQRTAAARETTLDHWGGQDAHASYGNAAAANPGYGNAPQAGYGAAQAHKGVANGHFDQAGHYGADQFGGAEEWGHNDPYGQHEPSLGDAHGYGHDQQAGSVEQSYAEDDDYEDEPRRRGRLPMIAAAAVVALLCGGGLAYGYKAFLSPSGDGKLQVIKNSVLPSKVKPDDPGGRKFAHSDNKIMGGPLNDASADGAAPGPGDGATGSARKVATVEVRPDGSLVSSDRSPVTASATEFPTAGQAAPSPSASADTPPKVIARAEPSSPPAALPDPEPEAAVEAPAAAVPPKKVIAKKVIAAVPASPGDQPIGPQPTGAGWVAVLASVPVSQNSQANAIQQFADMEQKYGEVLQGKVPSVQEANLGEKGRYHRLVVGPPASREAANSICGSLKSQGYSGCWVLQY